MELCEGGDRYIVLQVAMKHGRRVFSVTFLVSYVHIMSSKEY